MRPFIGFADQWLVDALGIEAKIPHALMDATCYAIPQEEFSYIGMVYDYIRRHVDNQTLAWSPVTTCAADVQGMTLYMCAYYSRFSVVDSLTSDAVKASREYRRCVDIVRAVPDVTVVIADLVVRYKQAHPFQSTFERFEILQPTEAEDFNTGIDNNEIEAIEAATGAINVAAQAHPTTNVVNDILGVTEKKSQANDQKPNRSEPGKAEEKSPAPEDPVKKRLDRRNAIISTYQRLRHDYEGRYGMGASIDFPEDKEYAIMMFGIKRLTLDSHDYDAVVAISKHLNKHVMLVHCGYREADTVTKRFLDTTTEYLAIMTRPEYSGFMYYEDGGENIASVLGEPIAINEIAFVKSQGLNAELDKIRLDRNLTAQARTTKLNEIINTAKNRPLTGYDKIFRDWATGVVYAVMKNNEIVFLVKSIWRIHGSFVDVHYQLTNSQTACAERHEEVYKLMRQATKNNLIRAATSSIRRAKERIKEELDEQIDRFNNLKTEMLELSKTINTSSMMWNSMDTSAQHKSAEEKAAADYELIMQMKNVRSMFIINEAVHIYTRTIYAKDERTKRWHEIGDFHIIIYMHSDRYDTAHTVRVRNLKNHVVAFSGRVMEAPHVFQDGHICHGNLAVGMAEAYKSKDLYQLVMQLLLFLGYANTDDSAGAYVNQWPEVSEDIALGKVPDPSIPLPYPKEQVAEEVKFDEELAGAIPIPVSTIA